MTECPCGSGVALAQCCQPYISGAAEAPTAESLMRARYTAHTLLDMQFLVDSHVAETRGEIDLELTRRWAERCQWLGLEITRLEAGGEGDEHGAVEFVARYRERDERREHRERALFVRENGRWLYRDAEAPRVETARRGEPKVGRNDPCPCGSGLKYKKCHGR